MPTGTFARNLTNHNILSSKKMLYFVYYTKIGCISCVAKLYFSGIELMRRNKKIQFQKISLNKKIATKEKIKKTNSEDLFKRHIHWY